MIGFISAPAWYDPAPSEFPQVVEEEVRTQQAPLLLPEFDYHLKSFARIQGDLNLCARSLSALGCDLVVQVGSPFAWAGVTSEAEARERNRAMEKASGVPAVMTGLAIVDGLRAIGANKVAVTCTYYEPEWRDAFRAFLRMCGFEVLHASTLAEQALADSSAKMKDYGWSMTSEIAGRSILAVADAAPDAEAIVVTGSGTRTLSILCDMESQTGRPLVAADTIVYWAAARELELTIKPVMGSLAKSARALVKD
jgi:maleate isomerase